MAKTKQIDISKKVFFWMRGSAEKLVAALGPGDCRFVGGAVRDSLIGRMVVDVDMATSHPPEFVIDRLKKAGIKVIPTGLKHGTVTAVFPDRHFEVTTLRHDVETFGRHAEVAFHDDWQADAARRDFTINALYLTADGTLFDYFDGEPDLKAGKVCFIGDAAKRIEEDALRILRLFRFHAWYGKGDVDTAGLKEIREKLQMLEVLSPERIRDELFKLLKAPDPVPVLRVMEKVGVLARVFEGFAFDFRRLGKVVRLENDLGLVSALRRLGAFLKFSTDDAKEVYQRFHLANREMRRLSDMAALKLPEPLDDRAIRKLLYHHGAEAFRDCLILNTSDKDAAIRALAFADETTIPKFPVTGKDLKAAGVEPGIEMGKILSDLEKRWVDSDFLLGKKDLLKTLS